jgi:hypothetical protein
LVNVSFDAEFFVPLQSNVYVQQTDITALNGSVILSGAVASESIGEQSFWTNNFDTFGVFSDLTSDYTTEHGYTLYGASSSDTYDRSASDFSAWGSEVAVDQHDISAVNGGIVAHDAFAGLAIDRNNEIPVVVGGDVSISQTYLTASGNQATGVNINSAHASLYSEDAFVLVSHTATSEVSLHEYFVETVGGVLGHLTTQTDDYTFYSSTIDYGGVHVQQHDIVASAGDISAADAAVSIDVAALYSGDLYISQDYFTANNGDIDAHGAHVAITALGEISLSNSYYTMWSTSHESATAYGGAFTDNATTADDHSHQAASAYIEQYDLQAYNGSVNLADASVVLSAGSLTAYNVYVSQDSILAGNGGADISGATVGVSVGDQGDIYLGDSAFINQYQISASDGSVNASSANVALTAGADSHMWLNSAFVQQIDIGGFGDARVSDAGVVLSAGDGAYIDLTGAAFVRQAYISAGGNLNAGGAHVEINMGGATTIGAELYSNDAFVQQDHLSADHGLNVNDAAVSVVLGDSAYLSIVGSAFISQDNIIAGNHSELNVASASVALVEGNNGHMTVDAAYIEQNHLYGGAVDISNASVGVNVGYDGIINLNSSAYIAQNWVDAQNGDISLNGAQVTLSAGDNSDVFANDVLVTQTEITASGNIDMSSASAVVDGTAGVFVTISGSVDVVQSYATAGGNLYASDAQVRAAVGADDANEARNFFSSAFISQVGMHAGENMSLDNATVNVLAGECGHES